VVGGVVAAVHFSLHASPLDRAGFLNPASGTGSLKVSGSEVANILNPLGFLARQVVNFGRGVYLEQLRLQWEDIFEQGMVTRDGLDRYVSRLFNGAPYLGITALQRTHIAAATEQFWANYTYLRDQPLTDTFTEQQRFLALHAKVGEYQITVSREGNLQDSSVSALDPRRPSGRWFRTALFATYGVNETVALNWLNTSGLHQILSASFLHQASGLADAQNGAELLYRGLFLLGTTMPLVQQGAALIGGLFDITTMETHGFQRFLQRWGQLALGVGGAAWTVQGALTTATQIHMTAAAGLHGDWLGDGTLAVMSLALTLAKAAFTWADLRVTADEFRRAGALPMRGPMALARPQIILAGALGAAMILTLAQTGGSNIHWHHMPWDGTSGGHGPVHPNGTPVPSASRSPSLSPSPSPSLSAGASASASKH
jgi:hypothetical protein